MSLNSNSKQDIIEENKNNINNISNNNESKDFSNPFESNSKSRNNKSNLKYQSSDELIKIAMQKGKKQNQETPGKSNVNINFSQNIKDIPPFAKNLPVSVSSQPKHISCSSHVSGLSITITSENCPSSQTTFFILTPDHNISFYLQ